MVKNTDWESKLLAASVAQLEESMPDSEGKSRLRSVRFDESLDALVEGKAKALGMTVSQFLRFAAERLLDIKICPTCRGTGITRSVKEWLR